MSKIITYFSKSTYVIFLSFTLIVMSSCKRHYNMSILASEEDQELMEDIARAISSHSEFEIEVVRQDSLTEIHAIDAILKGKYDVTPVNNTLDYKTSKEYIRTIIPLFHEVLVVLSRHKLSQNDVDSLLKTGDYLILTKEVEELDMYQRMIPSFNGDSTINYRIEDHFNLEKDLQSQNLLLFFSGKENKELGQLIFDEKAYIYSLDRPDSWRNGSFIEGFCRDYKKTTPFILSRNAFGIVLDKPVFTIAVHELLITTTEMPDDIIYDLIETIHGHHIIPIFESSNNYSFEVNHQDINLSFPFHNGTIDYLEREKPKFVERYAEVMGFVLSAFVLTIGMGATLKATFNRQKKNRMDEYYKILLHFKANLTTIDLVEMKTKLDELQKKVFELLIDEKLRANNEFLIFMVLWKELYKYSDKQIDKD